MVTVRLAAMTACLAMVTACSGTQPDTAEAPANGVSLRNLTEAEVATEAPGGYAIEGTFIPTPSDPNVRHYLIRTRRTIDDTVIAIIREERGGKVAYARTEVDCAQRRFHVLGVGDRRATAETNIAHDGPLRSIEGLPLRQELAAFACARNGTPLAPAKG